MRALASTFFLVLTATTAFPADPASQPATAPALTKAGIRIAKDTTYVDGPVLEDGTIDYIAAYNTLASKGITPGNNAAVLFVRILGPRGMGYDTETTKEICQRLGTTPPTPNDPTMMSFDTYLKYVGEHEPSVPGRPTFRPYDEVNKFEFDIQSRIVSADECPELTAWVAAQKPALAIFHEAAKRDHYFIPFVPPKDSHGMLQAMRMAPAPIMVASNLRARINFQMAAGDFSGARQDLLDILRIARLVQNSPIDIDHLTGAVSESRALEQIRRYAATGKLSAVQLRTLIADLNSLPPQPESSASPCERFQLLDWVMQIRRGSAEELMRPLMMSFDQKSHEEVGDLMDADPNILLRFANSTYDESVAACVLPTYRQRAEAFRVINSRRLAANVPILPANDFFEILMGATSQNATQAADDAITSPQRRRKAVQDFLKRRPDETIPNYSLRMAQLLYAQPIGLNSTAQSDERQTMTPLTLLSLALAAYHADKNTYPDSLAPLAPAYLAKLPNDPFSDQPFVYRRTPAGYILYSIGPNLTDDAGTTRKEKPTADDITISVP